MPDTRPVKRAEWMDANETFGVKRRFWSRRKLVVFAVSVATVILLAGLLVWFSAPKNELLTEMTTQQSRLKFLGPLRQPVSAAWQRFRGAWIKPLRLITYSSYQLSAIAPLPADLGAPVLTNESGVAAWILGAAMTESALKKLNLVRFDRKATVPDGTWGPAFIQGHRAQCRPRSSPNQQTSLEVFVFGEALQGQFQARSPQALPSTNHPSLKPFGARVTVPNGSALLILGPIPEFDPANRFAGLFIPE